jgi:MtN3 and saliva related transmembrane protein
MIDIIGYMAAIITTLSFVPQVLHTIKTKDTSGISLVMYSTFVVGLCLWFAYGVLLMAWPIIIANGITIVLASIILYHKLQESRQSK